MTRAASAITLPDLHAFIADLRGSLGADLGPGTVTVARAPGRLDVLGGIADYSGSLCLELPLREAACAAVQRRTDGKVVVISPGDSVRGERFAASAAILADRSAFHDGTAAAIWTRYLLGPCLLLHEEHSANWRSGLTIILRSAVPEGAGVSSSAAIEVAVLTAAAAVAEVNLAPRALALLAQRVENLLVGAPCGVMDQCTVACAEADALLRLLCQPCELQGHVRLPDNLAVWGINSGQRHAVGGGDYGSVRTACAMGTVLLARHSGATVTDSGPGRVTITNAPWGAYIVNLPLAHFSPQILPDKLLGADYLRAHHGVADPLAIVDPQRTYAVRACTAHPIKEHPRVVAAAELLPLGTDTAAKEVGALMFASHDSYGACGLGASGPDRLVALVREAIAAGAPLFGAKITGGGSGGTVAILGRPAATAAVHAIAARYAQETGRGGQLFAGSSPGACAVGAQTISFS